jgi:hypothetical protein
VLDGKRETDGDDVPCHPSFEGSAAPALVPASCATRLREMRKLLFLLTVVLAATSLAVGVGAASAAGRPGAFAEFKACMKANGAPVLDHRLSADERAALRRAFTACRSLLPKPKFVPPTAARIAAFKSCMADKGFSSTRPDLRDPAVRRALKAALRQCFPLLKPS